MTEFTCDEIEEGDVLHCVVSSGWCLILENDSPVLLEGGKLTIACGCGVYEEVRWFANNGKLSKHFELRKRAAPW